MNQLEQLYQVDRVDYEAANAAFVDHLTSRDEGMFKQAVEVGEGYIKTHFREDSILDKIVPPEPVGPSDLDPVVWTDKPFKIVDIEPRSPAAITVPFGGLPSTYWIRGKKVPVGFDRIKGPRHMKDTSELLTYRNIDIRQVLSDMAVKDLAVERDGKFFRTVNEAMVGVEQTVPETGVKQWRQINGGISRESLIEAAKIMTRSENGLSPVLAVTNHTTIYEVWKFGRDEMGGDASEEILKNGFAFQKFLGMTWLITIKKTIVPTGTIFFFAAPEYLGRNFILSDVSLHVKREDTTIEFTPSIEVGAVVGNVAGVARVDYTGVE